MVKRIDAVQNYKTKTKDTERVFFFFNVKGHSLVTLTCTHCSSFPGCLVGKNPPASAGDTGDSDSILGQEDLLKEETANPSSVVAWRIPRTEKPDKP